MRANKDFYIGWQEKMPAPQRKLIKRFVILCFLLIPILSISISWQQKAFNDHKFELGKETQISGRYYAKPVPMLIADGGLLPAGLSPHILLVGYGKFGAEGIMEEVESQEGNLDGKKITMAGTLIYGAGKTVMELTKKEKSLVRVDNQNPQNLSSPGSGLDQSLTGEILDPKCYFGVMKPGEGKIHKSCAIRCISGGIAPVFRSSRDGENYQYYILLGAGGEKINQEILPFVAEKVNISGKVVAQEGWNILYAAKENIKRIAL